MSRWARIRLMAAFALCCSWLWATSASAASKAASASAPVAASNPAVRNSSLNSQSFLDIFTGELAAYYGDRRIALDFLLRAAQDTKDDSVYDRAVGLAESLEDPALLLNVAQAWLKDSPDSKPALRAQLAALLWSGRTQESAQLLRRYAERLPVVERDTLVQHWLQYLVRAPRLSDALPQAERLVSDYPSTVAMQQLASLYLEQGLSGPGTDWLSRAQTTGTPSQSAATQTAYLALRYYRLNPVRMGAIITRQLRARPNDNDLRMAFAQSLVAQDDAQGALELARDALHQDPMRLDALLISGVLLAQANRTEEAEPPLRLFLRQAEKAINQRGVDEASAREAQRLSSSVTTARLALAEMYQRQRKTKLADEQWQQIRDDEALIAVAVRRAVQLFEAKQPQAADDLLNQLPSNDEGAQRNQFDARAAYLRQTKQFPALLALYVDAVSKRPDDAELKYEAALAADSAKNYPLMERWLRELLQSEPNNRNALNALGYSLADRNLQLPEARRYIEQALQLAPNDPFILDSLGWVQFRQGQLKEARETLTRAYAIRRDPDIAAHLGEVLWQMGDKDRAMSLWREANQRTPGNDALLETMRRFGVLTGQ